MSTLQSVIMGAIQGITEFLPISSSAHLIVIPWFFHIDEGNINKLTYDVMLHFGTLLAILAIYGKRFIRVIIEGFIDLRDGKFKDALLLKIIVATIPAGVAGLLGKDFIEQSLRIPFVTVFTLALVSVLMIISERLHVSRNSITYPVAIAIGIAQAFALIPGVSRSGITITAALLLGLKRSEAVDFSFFLAIPIILGTSLYEMRHLDIHSNGMAIYIYGAASALVFGILSLKFLINYLKKHTLDLFAYYRIGIAILILICSI
jgi:undecaprenyl-diphosphatase